MPGRQPGAGPSSNAVPGRGQVEGCQEGEAELPGVDMANIALAAMVELATAVAVASASGSSSKAESLGFLGRGQSLHVWPVVYASSICTHQPFHINMCFTYHFSHTCTCSAVGCVFCSMCDNAFSMHRTPLPRLAGERPIKTIVRLSCGVADVLWCALRMPKESIPFPYMPGDVQFSMNSSSSAAMSCVTVGRLGWSV